MSAPLHDIWDAASANPYQPFVPKSLQFTVGFLLLLVGTLIASTLCTGLLLTCAQHFFSPEYSA